MARLFAEDFARPSVPDKAAAPDAEPQVPSFDAAELAAACEAAREEGRLAGLAEAAAGERARTATALARLAAEMQAARADLATRTEALAQDIAATIMAAFAAAFPALCARHGEVELRAIIARVIGRMEREPRIRVWSPPDHLHALADEIAALPAEIGEKVELRPDARLGPADIRITWHLGKATRDSAALWAEIEAILTENQLLPTPDAETAANIPGAQAHEQ
jgi:flagellar biosynthesis/type III secretory pathway protein FliH